MVRKYPIILGPGHRKGIAACKSKTIGDGVDLFILRLKKDLQTGDKIHPENINGIEAVLHFCDKGTVQVFINVLSEVLDQWKEEDP